MNAPTATHRALVRNAGDVGQVKRARETERFRRDREVGELRAVLATLAGRRVLWRLMEQCGTFESIMETSAKIYYRAGKQDVGHYLLAEVIEADPTAYQLMMADAKAIEDKIIEPAMTASDEGEDSE